MSARQAELPRRHWFKSSYSGGSGGDCVEIAPAPATVHIRDSKTPATGILTVRPAAWSAFLALARQD